MAGRVPARKGIDKRPMPHSSNEDLSLNKRLKSGDFGESSSSAKSTSIVVPESNKPGRYKVKPEDKYFGQGPTDGIRFQDSFSRTSPKNYYFVEYCQTTRLSARVRQISRDRGLLVYNVSDASENANVYSKHTISGQCFRVGFHFHGIALGEAMREEPKAGHMFEASDVEMIPLERSQRLERIALTPVKPASEGKQKKQAWKPDFLEFTSAQMYDMIKEQFPYAPDDSIDRIISHSFFGEDGKVGKAKDLTISRRIQLAVLAHIRHEHTAYDQHLKVLPWQEVRLMIESECIAKMKEWRGEDGKHWVQADTMSADDDRVAPELSATEDQRPGTPGFEEMIISDGARAHFDAVRTGRPISMRDLYSSVYHPTPSRPPRAITHSLLARPLLSWSAERGMPNSQNERQPAVNYFATTGLTPSVGLSAGAPPRYPPPSHQRQFSHAPVPLPVPIAASRGYNYVFTGGRSSTSGINSSSPSYGQTGTVGSQLLRLVPLTSYTGARHGATTQPYMPSQRYPVDSAAYPGGQHYGPSIRPSDIRAAHGYPPPQPSQSVAHQQGHRPGYAPAEPKAPFGR